MAPGHLSLHLRQARRSIYQPGSLLGEDRRLKWLSAERPPLGSTDTLVWLQLLRVTLSGPTLP